MTLRRMLKDGAARFAIDLTDEQVDACFVYLLELDKWNRKISLTAIRDEQEIVVKHFIDSFSYRKGFEPAPDTKLLDMGSGAGFPALPLKIAFPGISVTLVESVQKKAAFLRHIVRTLRLSGAEVADRRTDALPGTYAASFDVVTARAFASMETALQEGVRFLKPGGVMVLSRGPSETVEETAASALGAKVEARHELALPVSGDRRVIWVFRRTG